MPRKGENIYKRKDNRWEARYIKGRTGEGSAYYGYCYAKSYREVKEKVTRAKSALSSVRTGTNRENHRKLSSCCDDWLLLKRDRVKESTYVKYSIIIENHIKPKFGGYSLSDLNTILIESYSHEMVYNEGLSSKSVRDILTVLHAVMKDAQKYASCPLPVIEMVYPREIRKEMRVLSREEQFRFMNYLVTDMDECRFGILLALLTGLRIGELCALRWQDIRLEEKIVCISSTMQRLKDLGEGAEKKTRVMISSPKSENSLRKIPLTDDVVELCRKREPADSGAYVLTGEAKHYMEPRTLQYRLKHYAEECGIEGVHFHVLRHTFATRCVEVGFDIKSLSEILGHTNPKFTLERYVHSSMDLKRSNMNKLFVFEKSFLSPSEKSSK